MSRATDDKCRNQFSFSKLAFVQGSSVAFEQKEKTSLPFVVSSYPTHPSLSQHRCGTTTFATLEILPSPILPARCLGMSVANTSEPGIFVSLVVAFVLIAILSVGLKALASLQVPYGAFEKDMGPAAQKK